MKMSCATFKATTENPPMAPFAKVGGPKDRVIFASSRYFHKRRKGAKLEIKDPGLAVLSPLARENVVTRFFCSFRYPAVCCGVVIADVCDRSKTVPSLVGFGVNQALLKLICKNP
jgi:hypothetical protein